MRKNYILFLILLLAPVISYATHVRAGEITATRVEGSLYTYKVRLVTYTDFINGFTANQQQEQVTFDFGYSTTHSEKIIVRRTERKQISPVTERNVYETTYTFPGAGYYTIGCGIVNRNANTINLAVSNGSDNVSFFVQTSILINSNIGYNSPPVLLNMPLDSAALGQRFIHNPGAFDIDGDSLSYKLVIPRKDVGSETGVGEFIKEYLEPNTIGPAPVLNQAGTGPATFTIDPRTGDLVWDVPREAGQYNIAFVIEEWRKGFGGTYTKIGEIVRDMQIIVVATDNKPPKMVVPEDICVEAGETLEFEVYGEDEDISQPLRLYSAGGVYNLDAAGQGQEYVAPEAAVFTSSPSPGKVVGKFKWNTNCLHARSQAYSVLFRVVDSPGRFATELVDIKTMNIKVLPPRVKGLVAVQEGSGHRLNWQKLAACNESGKLLIYRKNGCSGLNPGNCTIGMPDQWGYTLIGEVSTGDTTFLDNTITAEGIYSYRIVTEVVETRFVSIQSAPSNEYCIGAEIKPGTSVMTKVSVSETSVTNGKIEVEWSLPLDANLDEFLGEKVYKLYRAEGIGGENFSLIHTQTTTFQNEADLKYTDQNLNTQDKVYRYKVEFYTEGNKLNSTSNPASSVRLSTRTGDKVVPLTWEANTPWANTDNIHFIYRQDLNDESKFHLIKTLEVKDVNTFTFTDNGQDDALEDGDQSIEILNGETYCYKVLTHGKYPDFPALGQLPNYSQVICSTPMDQTPPCTPVFTVSGALNCEDLNADDFCNESTFANTLRWNDPEEAEGKPCRSDITSYEIYFSRYDDGEPILLATVPASGNNTYIHRKNAKEGFAGCYTIKAKNSLGLLSASSQKICFDNCEKLSFPTAFSPNNDGKNDTFTPMNCSAFIQGAQITIYSAHGQLVRKMESESIEWDGKDDRGKDVASGTYYYHINVKFERVSKEGSTKDFKGYVTLIR